MTHVRLYDPGTLGGVATARWCRRPDGQVVARRGRLPRRAVPVEVYFACPEEDDGAGVVVRPLLAALPPPTPPPPPPAAPRRRRARAARTVRRVPAAPDDGADDPPASRSVAAQPSVDHVVLPGDDPRRPLLDLIAAEIVANILGNQGGHHGSA